MKKKIISGILMSTMFVSLCACTNVKFTAEKDTTVVKNTQFEVLTEATEIEATEIDATETDANKELSKELINGIATILENHKTETLNSTMDISMTLKSDEPIDGVEQAVMNSHGELKQDINTYYMQMTMNLTVADTTQSQYSETYQTHTDDGIIVYTRDDADSFWYKYNVNQGNEQKVVTEALTYDKLSDIKLKETESEYIITATSTTKIFDQSISTLDNLIDDENAIPLKFNMIFDKKTKEYKQIAILFDPIRQEDITMENTTIVITHNGYSDKNIEITKDIIDNSLYIDISKDEETTGETDPVQIAKSNDVNVANTLYTGMLYTMVDEDVYNEINNYTGIICRIDTKGNITLDDNFVKKNKIDVKNSKFINEFSKNIGTDTTISYKEYGADHWIVYWDNEKSDAIIRITDSNETKDKTYEIRPNIDKIYN